MIIKKKIQKSSRTILANSNNLFPSKLGFWTNLLRGKREWKTSLFYSTMVRIVSAESSLKYVIYVQKSLVWQLTLAVLVNIIANQLVILDTLVNQTCCYIRDGCSTPVVLTLLKHIISAQSSTCAPFTTFI